MTMKTIEKDILSRSLCPSGIFSLDICLYDPVNIMILVII